MPVNWPSHLGLKVGETRALTLRGLAAAGYAWEYDVSGPQDVVSVSLEPAGPYPEGTDTDALLPGSSRDERAILRGLRQGEVIIRFALRRPWEHDQPPVEEHRIAARVDR